VLTVCDVENTTLQIHYRHYHLFGQQWSSQLKKGKLNYIYTKSGLAVLLYIQLELSICACSDLAVKYMHKSVWLTMNVTLSINYLNLARSNSVVAANISWAARTYLSPHGSVTTEQCLGLLTCNKQQSKLTKTLSCFFCGPKKWK